MARPSSSPKRPGGRGPPQLPLGLLPQFGWGGERRGAGRRASAEPGISHRRQLTFVGWTPVHVTLRVRDGLPTLRTPPAYAAIAAALRRMLRRREFRVVHFSVQVNHIHLVVDAASPDALSRGMRALSGRIAGGLNRLMRRRGPVFAQDRYRAHVLRTPTEVENAVAYVVGNFASHARRRGERIDDGFVDPYSSEASYGPDGCRPPVAEPVSWLLRTRSDCVREEVAAYAPEYRAAA